MLITLDATPLLGRRTGIGRYVEHLLGALAARSEQDGLELQASTWTWRGAELSGLPAHVRPVGRRVPARLLRELWTRADLPVIETLVGATDVFHGTNFVSPPTRRAREVVTVHDLTYVEHRETVDAATLAYERLVARSVARGATVLTPSRTVAAAVRAHYDLPQDAVAVTPLGVDDAWFEAAAPSASWLQERTLPDRYVVFVGSLDPRKNLPRLLQAHEQARRTDPSLPDLVLAGPAGRATPDGVGPAVHLTGWLSDEDLRTLVGGASGLVLPSLDEGFGLPAIEAAAAGVPVLASDLAVLHEVAAPDTVFAPPTDVDALSGALLHLAQARRTPDADDARRAWARQFTWQACAAATLAAYATGRS
ncbi:glycosyltransferase family 4 protein [Cellulomonas xylanilytica]|uniref:Glycosyl transferase n=1 Tax=Cellulomonas xylanilytica TaxID=233583 RepID=A0A510V473_9CELL|nr:glycosyltransferase family 1 protein [Cellulomonas xylanilytica]GEK21668.1 glycosyl transferase [Cellulomonas xylanilytica]